MAELDGVTRTLGVTVVEGVALGEVDELGVSVDDGDGLAVGTSGGVISHEIAVMFSPRPDKSENVVSIKNSSFEAIRFRNTSSVYGPTPTEITLISAA